MHGVRNVQDTMHVWSEDKILVSVLSFHHEF